MLQRVAFVCAACCCEWLQDVQRERERMICFWSCSVRFCSHWHPGQLWFRSYCACLTRSAGSTLQRPNDICTERSSLSKGLPETGCLRACKRNARSFLPHTKTNSENLLKVCAPCRNWSVKNFVKHLFVDAVRQHGSASESVSMSAFVWSLAR